jgi:CDP-diacylglycerol--serine O-phosphatidyltransferase
MNLKAQIPNLLTLGNALLGVGAIICIFNAQLTTAAYLIVFAAVLDVFDGMVARLLKVSGDLGKQLDSLADAISFGVVPALIATYFAGGTDLNSNQGFVSFFPIVMAAFAVYRLAKFNIDSEQSTVFKGLPTPANALFWISLPLILEYGNPDRFYYSWLQETLNSPEWISLIALICGILMVSNIRLLSLKISSLHPKENIGLYTLLAASVIVFLLLGVAAIPIILLLYLFISIIARP